MSISYFDSSFDAAYVENDYRYKELNDSNILITTPQGSWILLSKQEFSLLQEGQVNQNPDLLKNLLQTGVLVSKDNLNTLVDIQRGRWSNLFTGVKHHIISPTTRCMNQCVYCHMSSKPLASKGNDMDEDTAEEVVNFIFQSPSKSIGIEFQGGEPLLNFEIVQYIIEYAKKINKSKKKMLSFSLVSNFVKMDSDILNYLIENKVKITTSLDGPKELHDKNRKNKYGTYDNTVYWIDLIIKEQKYSLNALPTITKDSLPFGEEIVDEYIKRGLQTIFVRYLNPTGQAKENWSKIGYNAIEFNNFWKNVLDYIIEKNCKGINISEAYTSIILNSIIKKDHQGFTCLGSPCGSALRQTAYDHKGQIFACDESRSFDIFNIGNVFEQTYKNVFSSENVLNLVKLSSGLVNKCDSCIWNPHCGICLVNTFANEKTLNSCMPSNRDCHIRGFAIEHIFKKILFNTKDKNIMLKWI